MNKHEYLQWFQEDSKTKNDDYPDLYHLLKNYKINNQTKEFSIYSQRILEILVAEQKIDTYEIFDFIEPDLELNETNRTLVKLLLENYTKKRIRISRRLSTLYLIFQRFISQQDMETILLPMALLQDILDRALIMNVQELQSIQENFRYTDINCFSDTLLYCQLMDVYMEKNLEIHYMLSNLQNSLNLEDYEDLDLNLDLIPNIVRILLNLFEKTKDIRYHQILFVLLCRFGESLDSDFMISTAKEYFDHIKRGEYFTELKKKINIKQMFSTHTKFILTIAPLLHQYDIKTFFDQLNVGCCYHCSFKVSVLEFHSATQHYKETMVDFIGRFGPQNKKSFIDSINNYDSEYLLSLFQGLIKFNQYFFTEMKSLDGLAIILDRIYQIQPELVNDYVNQIKDFPLFVNSSHYESISKYVHSNSTDSNIVTKVGKVVEIPKVLLKYIIKLLIFSQKESSRSIVLFSLVSKQFHSICTEILSSYPVESLRVYSMINIGSQYSLFKNPPLHLRNYEIQFIPYHYKQICLENLISLTQCYYAQDHNYDDIEDEIEFSVTYSLIDAKNLKNLIIKEVGHFKCDNKHSCCYLLHRYDQYGKFQPNSQEYYDIVGWSTYDECNIDSFPSTGTHYIRVFLDYYNNDKFESIQCMDRTHWSEGSVDDQVKLSHIIRTIPWLNDLSQSKPSLNINMKLSAYPVSNFRAVTKPELFKMVSSLKYTFWDDCEYKKKHLDCFTEIKKLTMYHYKKDDFEIILDHSILLKSITFKTATSKYDWNEIVEIISKNKRVSKFSLEIIVNHYREKLKVDLVNSLFQKLSEIESIKNLKLMIKFDRKGFKLPLMTQKEINQNQVNLGPFTSIDKNYIKFYRK